MALLDLRTVTCTSVQPSLVWRSEAIWRLDGVRYRTFLSRLPLFQGPPSVSAVFNWPQAYRRFAYRPTWTGPNRDAQSLLASMSGLKSIGSDLHHQSLHRRGAGGRSDLPGFFVGQVMCVFPPSSLAHWPIPVDNVEGPCFLPSVAPPAAGPLRPEREAALES